MKRKKRYTTYKSQFYNGKFERYRSTPNNIKVPQCLLSISILYLPGSISVCGQAQSWTTLWVALAGNPRKMTWDTAQGLAPV